MEVKLQREMSFHSLFRQSGIALAFVLSAFAPTLLLQSLFPYPFLFLFFGAVMASAWFGGAAFVVPTKDGVRRECPDHYLPLLYVTGTRRSREAVTFPVEGVDGGSISMLAVRVG